MTSMTTAAVRVTGGIDTHKDLHMAAVVDRDDGRLLAIKEFSTTRAGYRALLRWMRSHGEVVGVGIECTGSYGAGVTRFLTAAGITTFEVDRPVPTGAGAVSPTPLTPRWPHEQSSRGGVCRRRRTSRAVSRRCGFCA